MTRTLFIQRLHDKAFAEKRRITLDEVAKQAGFPRTRLVRIVYRPGYIT